MHRIWKQDSGDGLADFVVILALVAVVLILAYSAYRGQLRSKFYDAARVLDVRG